MATLPFNVEVKGESTTRWKTIAAFAAEVHAVRWMADARVGKPIGIKYRVRQSNGRLVAGYGSGEYVIKSKSTVILP